jgi:D-sedoheptulose 7-phosphate isomerase
MTPALATEHVVADRIRESIAVKQRLLQSPDSLRLVTEAAGVIVESLRKGGKVFFFGNGGSAADAQHLAAELAGRYLRERPGLPGLALTTNTSCLTAIGNDYGYEFVFARQLQALGSAGDIAIGISTSGKAANVLGAVTAAKDKGLITIGMTGADGGRLKPLVDYCFCVPSDQTDRVQEVHILIGHILCEIVEEELFNGSRLS